MFISSLSPSSTVRLTPEASMKKAFRGQSGRLPTTIRFRAAQDSDLPFFFTLYGSTREEELAQVDWSAEQKDAFLRMQFEAQHCYYHEQYPDADYLVVQKDDVDIGRIYLHRRADELRLIDIALIPESRNQGLGCQLLRDLLDEGQASALPVRIHVETYNPAMALYLRLGFNPVEDQGVYQLMEWQPDITTS
jgi:ribosomal protein S18 acetylase RimI-like enzyme